MICAHGDAVGKLDDLAVLMTDLGGLITRTVEHAPATVLRWPVSPDRPD